MHETRGEQKNDLEYKWQYINVKRHLALIIFFFAVSFGVSVYLIGEKADINLFTASIVDTIIISPAAPLIDGKYLNKKVDIKGRITFSNGEPFKNSRVRFKNETGYTTTDNDGCFFFEGVEPGRHIISITKNETDSASVTIAVTRVSQSKDVIAIKLDDGGFLIQVPVDVTQIDIELDINGENLNLISAVDADKQFAPSTPVTPPVPVNPPVNLPDPITPVTPIVPPAPINPPAPVNPSVPGGPGGGGVPILPVALPGIAVSDAYETSGEWSLANSIDIFAPRPGNKGVMKIAADTVISPGAEGRYVFVLKNQDVYDVEYLIKLEETDQNDPELPMRYRLKKGLAGTDYLCGSEWQEADGVSTDTLTIQAGETLHFTLEWKWLTISDSLDTRIGMQILNPVYLLSIVINAWYK